MKEEKQIQILAKIIIVVATLGTVLIASGLTVLAFWLIEKLTP